ncbi:MAG: hypothetical protein JXD22_14500 [Sedimentisphaerales bacterium]|nr:hypothetical protein [Sedimentisphaerales bacterium]
MRSRRWGKAYAASFAPSGLEDGGLFPGGLRPRLCVLVAPSGFSGGTRRKLKVTARDWWCGVLKTPCFHMAN